MRRRRHRDSSHIISDVNITPLVDTCLVLLIMFMIATPIMVQQSLPVNLPKAHKGVQVSPHNDPVITVSFDQNSRKALFFFMQDKTRVSVKEIDALLAKKLNPE